MKTMFASLGMIIVLVMYAFQPSFALDLRPEDTQKKIKALIEEFAAAAADEKENVKRNQLLEAMRDADSEEGVKALVTVYCTLYQMMLDLPAEKRPIITLVFLDKFSNVLGSYENEDSVKTLIKMGFNSGVAKAKNNPLRPYLLSMAVRTFEFSKNPAGVDELLDLLKEADLDTVVLQDTIRAIGAIHSHDSLQPFVKFTEKETRWQIQLKNIEALVKFNDLAIAPTLLKYLEIGCIRVKLAAIAALKDYSGQNFGDDLKHWREWYESRAKGKEIKTADVTAEARKPLGTGATYYGIPIDSDRIIFIIDISNSMQDAHPELPGSKMEIAKKELIQAVKALPANAYFNIFFYAKGVDPWKQEMVQATDDNKKEAERDITNNDPARIAGKNWGGAGGGGGGGGKGGGGKTGKGSMGSGGGDDLGALTRGTYTFDVFEEVFKFIRGVNAHNNKEVVKTGPGTNGPVADTIFFMSDGIPWHGKTDIPDEILSAIYQWNRGLDITIHTIFIKMSDPTMNAKAIDFMQKIADMHHGKYVTK